MSDSDLTPSPRAHNPAREDTLAQHPRFETDDEETEPFEPFPAETGFAEREASQQPPSRPRFTGTFSRGKDLIQAEISLADSLAKLEDDDLAVQLYNVHHLKRRLYESKEVEADNARDIKQPWRRPRRWNSTGRDKKAWRPPDSWTSWPLVPERIPSPAERSYKARQAGHGVRWDDAPAEERQRQGKASQELEDCLTSEILGQARAKFYRRHREAATNEEHVSKKRRTSTLSSTKLVSPMEDPDSPGLPLDATDAEANHPDQEVDAALSTSYLQSQLIGKAPQILSDEAEAWRKCQPVIRHVIANLENLLQALHTSRKNHLSRSHDGHKPVSPSGDESSGASQSPGRQLPKIPPRDWSEVLGVAALTGWDPDVVRRAAARCSNLLNEQMEFATADQITSRVPSAWGARADFITKDGTPLFIDYSKLTCPLPKCKRHKRPYPSNWRLREHLKRSHGGSASAQENKKEVVPEAPDELLRPIAILPRWRRRSSSLEKFPPSGNDRGRGRDVARAESDASTSHSLNLTRETATRADLQSQNRRAAREERLTSTFRDTYQQSPSIRMSRSVDAGLSSSHEGSPSRAVVSNGEEVRGSFTQTTSEESDSEEKDNS